MQVIPSAPARPDAGSYRAAERSSLGQASFVLGIVAWVAIFVPPGLFLAPVCGLIATILGVVGLSQASRSGEGPGRAVTGLVLGATSLVASAALLWTFHGVIFHAIHQINAHVH